MLQAGAAQGGDRAGDALPGRDGEMLVGFDVLAGGQQGRAQVEPDRGLRRREFERGAQFRDGFVQPPFADQQAATVGAEVPGPGIVGDQQVQVGEGGRGLAGVGVGQRPVVAGVGFVRSPVQNPGQLPDRRRRVARPEQSEPTAEPGGEVVRMLC
ncbi:hypothetical protein Acor_67190 [Acrocarpospora corrugata]|uniref:Uncharacterized protein n=1 Tax=Acrocarpospora corrugata TaxID=35763 RepID=A0A5M3WC50_9ACTN|nr:hypothetical protein Acor_67190 [Acrocarpospora corrugata]